MAAALIAALFVSLAPPAQKGEIDNPYRDSKVGDWVEYKMTGPKVEGTTKMTVTAKDEKELSYEVLGTFTFNGQQMTAPPQTMKIDLTKSYDPMVNANMKANNVTVEKVGEGKEKVKVGGKEYDATWFRSKAKASVNGTDIVTDTRFWFAKGVPLSGLVKMESTMQDFTTKLELVGSGRK